MDHLAHVGPDERRADEDAAVAVDDQPARPGGVAPEEAPSGAALRG
jgi:hypothetical protein